MDNVVRLPNMPRMREEASAWLAKFDRGLVEAERDELGEWLAADPLHREVLLQLAALWDDLDVMSELAALFPFTQSPLVQRSGSERTLRRRRTRASTWRTAAAFCITGVAAVLVVTLAPRWARDAASPGRDVEEHFHTDVGAHDSRQLPDGSVVTLNTDTEVRVDYSTTSREIFLTKGEAHFDVAHDPEHPFTVYVGGRIVQAIGTAFNVQLRPGGNVEVTVTEGKVKVARAVEDISAWTDLPREFRRDSAAPDSPVLRRASPGAEVAARGAAGFDTTLVAGEAVIFDRDVPEIRHLEPIDIDIKLAWQRGMLIFRGEPLDQILEEVSRYTTTKLVLADVDLGSVRVGGYFQAGDIDGLLVALHENFQIESEYLADDRIVLRSAH